MKPFQLEDHKNWLFFLASLVLTLYVFCKYDPFYRPTIDDSAIVMRYLKNFQENCFFCYNIPDGPVFGVSDFWLGLVSGALSWMGLAPQASLITVSLFSTIFLFYAIFYIFHLFSKNTILSIAGGTLLYFSTRFLPDSLFNGLEVPLHLFLVMTTFLLFFQKRQRLFYVMSCICIISKLDSIFLIGFMMALDLLRAYLGGKLLSSIIKCALFFGIPIILWIAFATAVFGSPLPQSFLSKYLLRAHAPRTTWFPFMGPLLESPEARKSMAIALGSGVIAVLVAWARRELFTPSLVFAASSIGTLALYFVYNPGEQMSWYYPLPEVLILLTVFMLPFDAARLPRTTLAVVAVSVSVIMAGAVLWLRFPANQWIIGAAHEWTSVYEKQRRESGILANAVAPKDHPVLWTGHGYPAYEFNGYVVDYSALNFRGIWPAIKAVKESDPETRAFLTSIGENPDDNKTTEGITNLAVYDLMQIYKPNVFMLHNLFKTQLQRTLHLRLVGTFYNIDMVDVPAFRVFVTDPGHAEINEKISAREITVIDGDRRFSDRAFFANALAIKLPPHTSKLLFGADQRREGFTVNVTDEATGRSIGSCVVPANPPPALPKAIYACAIATTPSDQPTSLHIAASSGMLGIFEPVSTQLLVESTPHT